MTDPFHGFLRSTLVFGAAVVVLLASLGASSASGSERPVIDIPKVSRAPVLDEFVGATPGQGPAAEYRHITDLIQTVPVDGAPASQRTDAYLGYDDDNFYVVFVAHDADPPLIRGNLSRREQINSDDFVEIMLDTYHDQRRAYGFAANPLGVQWDALWTEGQDYDSSWDTLWHSDGKRTETGYVVTMSIPFRSLRFAPLENQEWGMLLRRDVQRNNESSFWPHVSTRIDGRMNQAATIRGMQGISPGRNIELIPYVTSRSFRLLDPTATPEPGFVEEDFDSDGGLDAKFVVLDNVSIDATINPDFSQVESDNPQVTVNERFEVFFPEKRPFFLENAGYFQTTTNLLFTRRIRDPQFGGRSTGKLGKYAFGVLAIDDQAPGRAVPEGDRLRGKRAFAGALRINRDISEQSTAGFMLTDREFDRSYNRVAAVDTRLRLGQTWNANGQVAYSWTQELDGSQREDPLLNFVINRNGRHFGTHLHYFDVGRDFDTDLGFVPRRDVRDLHQQLRYTFRPEGDVLISWGPTFYWQTIWDQDGTFLDYVLQPEIDWELTRQTEVELQYRYRGERLRPGDYPGLTEIVDYNPWEAQFELGSEFSNAVNVELELRTGQAINFVGPAGVVPELEDVREVEFDLVLRPTRTFNISTDYTFARLQDSDSAERIFDNHIVRSRWSLQFTRRWTLRAIFQFEQLDASPTLSRLEDERRFNTDLLLTYQVNAWTALFAGYNTNYLNLDLFDTPSGPEVRPTEDLHNNSEQFFVKFSYLLRI